MLGILTATGMAFAQHPALPRFDASNCWQTPGQCIEATIFWTAKRWQSFPTKEAGLNIVLNDTQGMQSFPVRTVLSRDRGAARVVFNPRHGKFYAEVFGHHYGPRVVEITGGGTFNVVVSLTPGKTDPRD